MMAGLAAAAGNLLCDGRNSGRLLDTNFQKKPFLPYALRAGVGF
jgi:hypothetical protein